MHPFFESFQNAMRAARKDLNMSQLDLALEVGCAQSSIGLIERGRVTPTFMMGCRICLVLGIDMKELAVLAGPIEDANNYARWSVSGVPDDT